MKTIVVYKSNTGFAKKYALWIQEELGCDIASIKDVNLNELNNYDCIIYGGGIMANMINGLDKIKKTVDLSKLVLYAVGATDSKAENMVNGVIDANKKKFDIDVPVYYFEGGINYEEMGFFSKKILKTIHNSLKKKKDRSDEDTGMMNALEKSFDHTNKEEIKLLIKEVKNRECN